MRLRTKIGFLLAFVGLSVFLYFFLTGPHMLVQEHIQTYATIAPQPPSGSVMVEAPLRLPSEEEAKSLKNPLPETAENLANGKTYYVYYCAFCHGATGAGDGPVGESYVPTAPDLRTEKVRELSDGQLLRAMLLGVGHAPALERIVPNEHRWQVVLYVRSLPANNLPKSQPAIAERISAKAQPISK